MFHIVLRILVTALALFLTARIVPGIEISNIYVAILAAIVLGLLNILVKPILFLFTLPITFLSLGLFYFVLNAAMFGFAAFFVEGFTVDGFLPALVGSLVVSLTSTLMHRIFP